MEAQDLTLVLIDFQERLSAAMPAGVMQKALRNVDILLTVAEELSIPVITTEQYPRDWDRLCQQIQARLNGERPLKKWFLAAAG